MLRVVSNGFRLGNLKVKTLKTVPLASFSTAAHPSETFLTGTGNAYMDEMYHTWKSNPEKVHKSWDVYFTQLEKNALPGEAFVIPPTIQPMIYPPVKSAAPSTDVSGQRNDAIGLSYLIRAYQVFGHDAADLDPLGIYTGRNTPRLDYRQYGFTEADLNRVITVPANFSSGVTGFLEELVEGSSMTLGNIIKRLNETYCNHIGVEYMHILGTEKCNWIRSKIEHLHRQEASKEKKLHILERLAFSEGFEKVCQQKFATTKRFGLDGGETLVPGLKYLVDRSTELGVERIVVGMPHRGRLNVLCNVLRKPADQLFREFMGTHFDLEKYKSEVTEWAAYGDVKYHLGTSCDRTYPDGRHVHLSLVANPSHLEAVDPVVEGKVRATQYYLGNTAESYDKVLPILLHGDAAFSGQGVVYETMNFSELPKYHNGGTIHVIVNNQVGFTTDPKYSRSSQSCSDLGKAFGIPIFHVNSDYPEDVVKVFELAAEWRQKFHLDAIINFTCYRRYGHNEVDNPEFTQPLMYQKISKMPTALEKYKQHLVKTNVATAEECDSIIKIPYDIFTQSFEASKALSLGSREDWLASKWESFKSPRQQSRIRETGVDIKTLQRIGNKICDIPTTFNIHRQLRRIIENKRKALNEGHGIDWGTAEALAFGSLLLEGNHVRISGQDVERGTFSHRHAVLHDQKTGETYTPLNHLAVRAIPSAPLEFVRGQGLQAELVASNSSLSEYGVLGFELGYSLENPNSLVIWEAQFGDFANGAQIIIDQFLSSGEAKWMRQCGLVVLLPHGYEGQGAEHSSCRIERFLQMSDDEPDVVPCMDRNSRMQIQQTNWQIVSCSTPANYFHALRRQIHRDFRKPLIVVQPKSLLRSKDASSSLTDMTIGESFRRVMPDPMEKELKNVKRIVFCTGKIYYELAEGRKEKNVNDVALVRVEQICPFPFDRVAKELKKHPNAEVVWAQEEPRNMGCWSYVEPRIITSLKQLNKDTKRSPRYVGRCTAAAPSTGYAKVHVLEQRQVVDDALA